MSATSALKTEIDQIAPRLAAELRHEAGLVMASRNRFPPALPALPPAATVVTRALGAIAASQRASVRWSQGEVAFRAGLTPRHVVLLEAGQLPEATAQQCAGRVAAAVEREHRLRGERRDYRESRESDRRHAR